jgi:hypothetical protein
MINITSIGHDGVYILRQKCNNEPATVDLWVTSDRSNGILQGGKAPQHEVSTGRVYVKVGVRVKEVFPSVYGLFWDAYLPFGDADRPPKPKRLKILS